MPVRIQDNDKNLSKDEDQKKNFFVMKFPNTKVKVEAIITQYHQKIEKKSFEIKSRQDNKNIALGTSKINYNDPRISVVWCKNNEVPIERVFSKNLRTKFPWAMSESLEWRF